MKDRTFHSLLDAGSGRNCHVMRLSQFVYGLHGYCIGQSEEKASVDSGRLQSPSRRRRHRNENIFLHLTEISFGGVLDMCVVFAD